MGDEKIRRGRLKVKRLGLEDWRIGGEKIRCRRVKTRRLGVGSEVRRGRLGAKI
jgi:hypothetical protein